MPARATTCSPRARAARAAMSEARYGPDRCPRCSGPFGVGCGMVMTVARSVTGHRRVTRRDRVTGRRLVTGRLGLTGARRGGHPVGAEDHQRRLRGVVVHHVRLIAVQEEGRAVVDLDDLATGLDDGRAAHHDRQLHLGVAVAGAARLRRHGVPHRLEREPVAEGVLLPAGDLDAVHQVGAGRALVELTHCSMTLRSQWRGIRPRARSWAAHPPGYPASVSAERHAIYSA